MKQYAYYEDGNDQILSESEVIEMFNTIVDEEQKANGTTFKSWLDEMIHMQILNPIITIKKFTIETSYSKETYYCNNIDSFLSDICFCDEYEVVSESDAEQEKISLYNETIERLTNDNISIDNFWNNNALLLTKGYYETYDEMINNNL